MILSLVLLQLLFSRWLFLSENQRFSRNSRFLGKSLFDVASIVFVYGIFGVGWLVWEEVGYWGLVLAALLSNTVLFRVERLRGEICYGFRVVTLFLHIIFLWGYIHYLNAIPGGGEDIARVALVSGYLSLVFFCMKESNYVIRCFFEKYRINEQKDPLVISGLSIESGRVIGALERLLLLFFIWHNALFAATVIVAIKGLARYNSMKDDSKVAEYVVMGTFLSLLLVLIAWTVFSTELSFCAHR